MVLLSCADTHNPDMHSKRKVPNS